jgi:hypothetical protein
VFGWTPSNEIGNGRWVMFGFFVGMMTEYATGVDFIHQLEQIVSYTGGRTHLGIPLSSEPVLQSRA